MASNGSRWRYCQVYAPVEQPKQVEPTPTDEGWRPFEECPDGVIVELLSTNFYHSPSRYRPTF